MQSLASIIVAATRASQIEALEPNAIIPVEWSTTTDFLGDFVLQLDETLPGMDRIYIFSWHHTIFNEIHGGVDASGMTPTRGDLDDPSVLTVDITSGPVSGVDFEIASSLQNEMVLMRDGVTRLATDIWRPSRRQGLAWPTLLNRTPYPTLGIAPPRDFAQSGYVVIQQNTRGRFGSEGVDDVFDDDGWLENQDGYDTIEWIAQQPWSDGKIGTFGLSAHGITQYMAAGALPPHLKCAIVEFATGNLYHDVIYTGGEFRKNLVERWLQDQGSLHKLDEYFAHPTEDIYWDDRNLMNRTSQVNVPMLHIGGWYDVFTQGTLDAFRTIHESGGPGARRNQKLVIGPWIHGFYSFSAQGELLYPISSIFADYLTTVLRWYDFWLKDKDNGIMDDPAVRYFVMGPGLPEGSDGPGNIWRTAADWPPPATPTSYYLQPGGVLATTSPPSMGGESMYTSNPADPVPTRGGGNLFLNIGQGPMDQRSVDDTRSDVMVWETAPLAAPVEATGPVTFTLYASSDKTDTDWMVKLEDVYPDGRAMLVTDLVLKARHRLGFDQENLMTPGTVHDFQIDLWDTSITFAAGHRIRVAVASSNYPRFEMNPQTGEPYNQHTSTEIATNRVQHSATNPSHLVLSVTDAASLEGCRPAATVPSLRIQKLGAGQVRLDWDPVADLCHARYRIYAGLDGPGWSGIVRRPVGETVNTFLETDDPGVFWQVVSEGTDGGNGPHGSP